MLTGAEEEEREVSADSVWRWCASQAKTLLVSGADCRPQRRGRQLSLVM